MHVGRIKIIHGRAVNFTVMRAKAELARIREDLRKARDDESPHAGPEAGPSAEPAQPAPIAPEIAPPTTATPAPEPPTPTEAPATEVGEATVVTPANPPTSEAAPADLASAAPAPEASLAASTAPTTAETAEEVIEPAFLTYRRGRYVDAVNDAREVIAVPDVHGDFLSLREYLLRTGTMTDTRPDLPADDYTTVMIEERYELSRSLRAGTQVVFLGDYIDRGPDSMEVISLVQKLAEDAKTTRKGQHGVLVHTLRGNHESIFLRFFELFKGKTQAEVEAIFDDPASFAQEMDFGGTIGRTSLAQLRCVVNGPEYRAMYDSIIRRYGSWENAVSGMEADETLDFLRQTRAAVIIDNLEFTHAGPVLTDAVINAGSREEAIEALDLHFAGFFNDPLSNHWGDVRGILGTSQEEQAAWKIEDHSSRYIGKANTLTDRAGNPIKDASGGQMRVGVWEKNPRLNNHMRALGLDHIYVGHKMEGAVKRYGEDATCLDGGMSRAYNGKGGILIIDPEHPKPARVVRIYDDTLHLLAPGVVADDDITEGRTLTKILDNGYTRELVAAEEARKAAEKDVVKLPEPIAQLLALARDTTKTEGQRKVAMVEAVRQIEESCADAPDRLFDIVKPNSAYTQVSRDVAWGRFKLSCETHGRMDLLGGIAKDATSGWTDAQRLGAGRAEIANAKKRLDPSALDSIAKDPAYEIASKDPKFNTMILRDEASEEEANVNINLASRNHESNSQLVQRLMPLVLDTDPMADGSAGHHSTNGRLKNGKTLVNVLRSQGIDAVETFLARQGMLTGTYMDAIEAHVELLIADKSVASLHKLETYAKGPSAQPSQKNSAGREVVKRYKTSRNADALEAISRDDTFASQPIRNSARDAAAEIRGRGGKGGAPAPHGPVTETGPGTSSSVLGSGSPASSTRSPAPSSGAPVSKPESVGHDEPDSHVEATRLGGGMDPVGGPAPILGVPMIQFGPIVSAGDTVSYTEDVASGESAPQPIQPSNVPVPAAPVAVQPSLATTAPIAAQPPAPARSEPVAAQGSASVRATNAGPATARRPPAAKTWLGAPQMTPQAVALEQTRLDTMLFDAVDRRDPGPYIAKALQEGASIEARRTFDSNNPLRLAAVKGNVEAIVELLDRGANIESADDYGNTALLRAALAEKPAAARVLIEAGADVNATNTGGNTALGLFAHFRTKPGHDEIVRSLIAHGADVEVAVKWLAKDQASVDYLRSLAPTVARVKRKTITLVGSDAAPLAPITTGMITKQKVIRVAGSATPVVPLARPQASSTAAPVSAATPTTAPVSAATATQLAAQVPVFSGTHVDEFRGATNVIAVGDIHGDLEALVRHLLAVGVIVDTKPKLAYTDFKVPPEARYKLNTDGLVEGTHVVFTGDYVDRGSHSIQVLSLVRALEASAATTAGKVLVHPLRGNHEAIIRKVLERMEGVTDKQFAEMEKDSSKLGQHLYTCPDSYFLYNPDIYVPTLTSMKERYGGWQKAIAGMKKDGTLDFIYGRKSVVIIDNLIFTHGGPVMTPAVLNAKSRDEALMAIEQHYSVMAADPNKQHWHTFSDAALQPLRDAGDCSSSYVSRWSTDARIASFLKALEAGHIYVGHEHSSTVRTEGNGSVTCLDGELGYDTECSEGGVAVIRPEGVKVIMVTTPGRTNLSIPRFLPNGQTREAALMMGALKPMMPPPTPSGPASGSQPPASGSSPPVSGSAATGVSGSVFPASSTKTNKAHAPAQIPDDIDTKLRRAEAGGHVNVRLAVDAIIREQAAPSETLYAVVHPTSRYLQGTKNTTWNSFIVMSRNSRNTKTLLEITLDTDSGWTDAQRISAGKTVVEVFESIGKSVTTQPEMQKVLLLLKRLDDLPECPEEVKVKAREASGRLETRTSVRPTDFNAGSVSGSAAPVAKDPRARAEPTDDTVVIKTPEAAPTRRVNPRDPLSEAPMPNSGTTKVVKIAVLSAKQRKTVLGELEDLSKRVIGSKTINDPKIIGAAVELRATVHKVCGSLVPRATYAEVVLGALMSDDALTQQRVIADSNILKNKYEQALETSKRTGKPLPKAFELMRALRHERGTDLDVDSAALAVACTRNPDRILKELGTDAKLLLVYAMVPNDLINASDCTKEMVSAFMSMPPAERCLRLANSLAATYTREHKLPDADAYRSVCASCAVPEDLAALTHEEWSRLLTRPELFTMAQHSMASDTLVSALKGGRDVPVEEYRSLFSAWRSGFRPSDPIQLSSTPVYEQSLMCKYSQRSDGSYALNPQIEQVVGDLASGNILSHLFLLARDECEFRTLLSLRGCKLPAPLELTEKPLHASTSRMERFMHLGSGAQVELSAHLTADGYTSQEHAQEALEVAQHIIMIAGKMGWVDGTESVYSVIRLIDLAVTATNYKNGCPGLPVISLGLIFRNGASCISLASGDCHAVASAPEAFAVGATSGLHGSYGQMSGLGRIPAVVGDRVANIPAGSYLCFGKGGVDLATGRGENDVVLRYVNDGSTIPVAR